LLKMAAAGTAATALGAGSARAAEVDPLWADVDAAAAKLIADQATPGLSISVLRKGRFVYSKGFGFANLETQTATTPKSVYMIGSITKQFTAASVMLLAEAGKLSVDDSLSKYFPDFPRGGEITLRQMLTHTSGLGDYQIGATSIQRARLIQQARLDYDADALYKAMLATDPLYVSSPGTVWVYSDTAYVLLGLIVQKLAGEPYGSFFRDGVIARAGLADTAVDDAADVVSHRASGYASRKGEPGRWDNAHYISKTFEGGAGAVRSTSEDLCRWHEALWGGRVVSAASLKEMVTPNRLKGGELPMSAPGPGYTAPPAPVQYGFGLETTTVDGRQSIGHTGHIPGFSSSLQTFPTEGVSIAILTNGDDRAPVKAIREVVVVAAVHDD
jgi:D-alanyl-D-alanine carboxypeptidase